MFAIGDASEQSGVNVETIRYYEREGIVPKPERTAAGRRSYTRDDIAKLRFVKRCRDLGFPIAIIQTFLSLSAEQGRSCGEVKSLAEDHLTEIDAKIENDMLIVMVDGESYELIFSNIDKGNLVHNFK